MPTNWRRYLRPAGILGHVPHWRSILEAERWPHILPTFVIRHDLFMVREISHNQVKDKVFVRERRMTEPESIQSFLPSNTAPLPYTNPTLGQASKRPVTKRTSNRHPSKRASSHPSAADSSGPLSTVGSVPSGRRMPQMVTYWRMEEPMSINVCTGKWRWGQLRAGEKYGLIHRSISGVIDRSDLRE